MRVERDGRRQRERDSQRARGIESYIRENEPASLGEGEQAVGVLVDVGLHGSVGVLAQDLGVVHGEPLGGGEGRAGNPGLGLNGELELGGGSLGSGLGGRL